MGKFVVYFGMNEIEDRGYNPQQCKHKHDLTPYLKTIDSSSLKGFYANKYTCTVAAEL